ncbi:MAG: cyclic nucleotide-binding domain-containing protein [Actinomycetota bacterium]
MASTEKQLAKQLANVPVFSGLKPKNRALMAKLGKHVTWAEGKVGVKEGSNASGFFLVVDGDLSVSQQGTEINSMTTGDFFGEIALLSGGKRTATVTATRRTQLFAIGRAALSPAIESNPDFAMDLLKAVALRQANDIV